MESADTTAYLEAIVANAAARRDHVLLMGARPPLRENPPRPRWPAKKGPLMTPTVTRPQTMRLSLPSTLRAPVVPL